MFNQHAPILAALYPGEDPLDLFLTHLSSKYESTMKRKAKATVKKSRAGCTGNSEHSPAYS